MKFGIQILTVLLILTSCKTGTNDERPKHKNLIGFKTSYLAELGDEKYFKLEKEVGNKKIETKYLNDIIYVSYFEILNACGNYDGNIEINHDTIKLKVKQNSNKVCTSLAINRVTFIIDNPDKKKKKIVK